MLPCCQPSTLSPSSFAFDDAALSVAAIMPSMPLLPQPQEIHLKSPV